MPNKKPDDRSKSSNSDPTPEIPLDSAGQVAVTYGSKPPKGPANKQIHPRRRLPEIPEAPPGRRDQK